MFGAGGFSSDPDRPWRADDVALERIEAASRWRGIFRSGRTIHWLDWSGAPCCCAASGGSSPRTVPTCSARRRRVPAISSTIFCARSAAIAFRRRRSSPRCSTACRRSGRPGLMLRGIPIGDAGRHPAVRTGDDTDQIVPFHKLSQWLTYSLLEPIEACRRHRDRARRAHRPAGISQRRSADRSRRDPSASADRPATALRGVLRDRRRMARADRGADGPIARRRAARTRARSRRSRCRTCCRAARGAPAGRSRSRCGRRAAPRRSPILADGTVF